MPKVYENPNGWRDAQIMVADTVANLRLQTPPTYVGNTVYAGIPTYPLAFVLGAAAAFDGTTAIYAWDPASGAADNGTTVIAPAGPQVGGNPGRWRRLGAAL